jgi:hypothetical protein
LVGKTADVEVDAAASVLAGRAVGVRVGWDGSLRVGSIKAVEDGVGGCVSEATTASVALGVRLGAAVGEGSFVDVPVLVAVAVKKRVANACCVCSRSTLFVGVFSGPVIGMIRSGSICFIGFVWKMKSGKLKAAMQIMRMMKRTR